MAEAAPQKSIEPIIRRTAPTQQQIQYATTLRALGIKPNNPKQAAMQVAEAKTGQQQQAATPAPKSLAEQLKAQSPGVNWDIQGIDRASELATWLTTKGVKDLSAPKLTWENFTTPATEDTWGNIGNEYNESYGLIPGVAASVSKQGFLDFGGVRVGNEGNIHSGNGKLGYIPDNGKKNGNQAFASSTKGHGAVSYQYVQRPDGSVQIIPKWVSTSDASNIRDIAKAAISLAVPGLGLGTALGSSLGLQGLAASVVGNGIASAGTSALMGARGSDIWKAGLGGAVGAGVGGSLASAGVNPILSKAGGSFAGSVASGRNVKDSLLNSVIGAGAGAAAGSIGVSPQAQNVLRVIISQGLKNATKKGKP